LATQLGIRDPKAMKMYVRVLANNSTII